MAPPVIAGGVADVQSFDRRRSHRVGLAVPVSFDRETGAQRGAVLRYAAVAQSRDVSAGGVYLTTRERGSFVSGEVLRVSIAVPEEARHLFPFSRIVGPCRVVRVDAFSGEAGTQGLAIAFCEDRMTMLSAIVFS